MYRCSRCNSCCPHSSLCCRDLSLDGGYFSFYFCLSLPFISGSGLFSSSVMNSPIRTTRLMNPCWGMQKSNSGSIEGLDREKKKNVHLCSISKKRGLGQRLLHFERVDHGLGRGLLISRGWTMVCFRIFSPELPSCLMVHATRARGPWGARNC